jgi:iron complex transport system substrate-binding protein
MQRKYLRRILFFIFLGVTVVLVSSIYLKGKRVVVSDFLDRKITFVKSPNRIVCLSPSLTEILFSLGLGDKVVGVSEQCDFPLEALNRPRFNLYSQLKVQENVIKEILSLQPDIVLLWGTHRGSDVLMRIVDYFERENVKVLTFGTPKDIDEIFLQISLLGEVFNQRESAEKLIYDMKEVIEQIKNKTKDLKEFQKPRVYIEIQKDPIITVGRNSYIQHIIELAGGKNIFEDKQNWPMVTPEEIVTKDPRVIIIFKGETDKDEVLNRKGWQEITAVKDGRVYIMGGGLIKRHGPRIVEGLKELARLLHPELFTD